MHLNLWKTFGRIVVTLAVFGGMDRNLPVDASVTRMRAAFVRGSNRDATIVVFPMASHGMTLVQDENAGNVPAHARQLSPGYIDLVLQWLRRQAQRTNDTSANMLEAGRRLTEAFFAGDLEPLWNRMTLEMRDAVGGSVEELWAFRRKVAELAGEEREVLNEEVLLDQKLQLYRRTVAFDKTTELMVVQWGLDENSAIADFFIRPAEPATSVTYKTKTELYLPFEGEWYVTAGGRTAEQNQHSIDYSNRFAYDLVSAKEFERTGPRNKIEDFVTWGKPILAPAAGTVAAVRDGVADNPPGEINDDPSVRMGNFVSIDHGNGEYSVLGHLQMGSLRVTVGDRLLRGDVVGLVGNSGNSNGPHLHYNLQDRHEPNRGKGLPAQFHDFVANGQLINRGEPIQGQRIRNR